MSLLIDVMWSVAIGLTTLAAALGLAPLIIAHVRDRRPPSGAHAKDDLADPAARRKAWQKFRYSLLTASTGFVILATESKDNTARWLVGIALVVIMISDLGSWHRPEPGTRIKEWRQLRWSLLPVASGLFCLANGWKYDTARWLLGIVVFMVVAPDFDSWFRSRMSHRSGRPTAERPDGGRGGT